MTIKFTTTDGRTCETTDKNVLFAATGNGLITPETIIEVDGKTVKAGAIKGLVFKSAPPNLAPLQNLTEPPRGIVVTISNLRGLIYLVATLNIIGAIFMWGVAATYESVALFVVSIGIIAGAVIGACMSMCVVDILEYIAKAVTKGDDK